MYDWGQKALKHRRTDKDKAVSTGRDGELSAKMYTGKTENQKDSKENSSHLRSGPGSFAFVFNVLCLVLHQMPGTDMAFQENSPEHSRDGSPLTQNIPCNRRGPALWLAFWGSFVFTRSQIAQHEAEKVTFLLEADTETPTDWQNPARCERDRSWQIKWMNWNLCATHGVNRLKFYTHPWYPLVGSWKWKHKLLTWQKAFTRKPDSQQPKW